MGERQTGRRVGSVLAVLALTACVDNPVTGQREVGFVSVERQIAIGEQQYLPAQQSQGGRYRVHAALTEYVAGVGARVADASGVQLPYAFVVLNNDVPNAWALPGGKIAVNRGLLTELQNEAELAAVLAHEVVHAAGRHGAQAMERGVLTQVAVLGAAIGASGSDYGNLAVGAASGAAALVNQRYGRDAEREADRYGIRYMAAAGYDPEAAVTLQQTFVRLSEGRKTSWLEGLFASHPPSAERVQNNRTIVDALRAEGVTGGELGADTYAAALAPLRADGEAYAAAAAARKAMADDRLEEAEALARKAVTLQDGEAAFHGLRGDVARLQRRHQAAVDAYDEAIAIDPDYFAYYVGRGVARSRLGGEACTRARRDFERSLTLLPTAIAYLELGRLAESDGDVDRAYAYFEAAAASDSRVGRAAREDAMRLDLPRNPGRYLNAEVQRDGRGRLLLGVVNRSSVTVEDVTVRVALMDAGGRVSEGVRRVWRIPPGGVDWQVLVNDGSTVRDARAGVVAARLGGADAFGTRPR
ncbi:MAG: M48 family metalloprotease [Gammaproteobacteria bacterium]